MNETTSEIGNLAWHVHDARLIEILTGPIKECAYDIMQNSPRDELDTRLRRLKLVKGKLPPKVIAASDKFISALKKRGPASRKIAAAQKQYAAVTKQYAAAFLAYNATLTEHADEINALHRRECRKCPWDAKQRTMFPAESEATG